MNIWAAGCIAAIALGVPVGTAAQTPAGGAVCREGFEDVAALYGEKDWKRFNTSTGPQPVNAPPVYFWDWWSASDGNYASWSFGAHAGSPYSRVMVVPHHVAEGGQTASAWLLTPEIDFQPGMALAFHTRTIWTFFGMPDRLYARVCTTGDCTNVGTGPDETGDFSTELTVVNPMLYRTAGGDGSDPTAGYPTQWARYEVTLPESGSGRVGFQYSVPGVFGAGQNPMVSNGILVAIDSVELAGGATCPFADEGLFVDGFELADAGVITQNANTTVVETAAGGCVDASNDPYGMRRSYLRRFDLDGAHGLTERVIVSSVDIGIGYAGTAAYLPVKLYAIDNDDPMTYANLELIGSGEMPVQTGESNFVRSVGVSGVIQDARAQDLVVEVTLPNSIFEHRIGYNDYPQTAPSYFASSDTGDQACGNPSEPTDWSTVPGGNGHNGSLLMTVHVDERINDDEGGGSSIQ